MGIWGEADHRGTDVEEVYHCRGGVQCWQRWKEVYPRWEVLYPR